MTKDDCVAFLENLTIWKATNAFLDIKTSLFPSEPNFIFLHAASQMHHKVRSFQISGAKKYINILAKKTLAGPEFLTYCPF